MVLLPISTTRAKTVVTHNLQQRLQHRYHHIHVYICKYCVCPPGPYVLLDFEIKLNISIINNYMYITYGRKKQ